MSTDPFPERIRPDRGVVPRERQPTLVFATICTKGRKPWLATDENHRLLRTIWVEATYWKVGPYIVMTDHVHFFAWPGRLRADTPPYRHARGLILILFGNSLAFNKQFLQTD